MPAVNARRTARRAVVMGPICVSSATMLRYRCDGGLDEGLRVDNKEVRMRGLLPNAPRLSCTASAGGRDDMIAGAHQYVGAQMEFCQDRAAAASTAS